ncbi:MAG: hypothetical protein JW947_00270 [Sedimentisphaerales bacterium]|nr:hypothetical protein [Sedimentisphaerales bacterium]
MNKRTVILIFTFLSCAALCAGAPLRDGFGLNGVDGKLTTSEGKWLFEFESAVSDEIGRIKAGGTVELLPSTALEKITGDAEKHSGANYRLWGNVTKYKGSNFIFPIYFLPVSPVEEPAEVKESSETKIAINEPNDTLAIPEEIVKKLKSRRVLRQEEIKEGMQLKQDYVITDRTALLDTGPDGKPLVVLDAIGRNIPTISFRLLPCEVLERAQSEQSVVADPVRFKIAGILTQYKGTYYLLLQKATRAYSHENFGG